MHYRHVHRICFGILCLAMPLVAGFQPAHAVPTAITDLRRIAANAWASIHNTDDPVWIDVSYEQTPATPAGPFTASLEAGSFVGGTGAEQKSLISEGRFEATGSCYTWLGGGEQAVGGGGSESRFEVQFHLDQSHRYEATAALWYEGPDFGHAALEFRSLTGALPMIAHDCWYDGMLPMTEFTGVLPAGDYSLWVVAQSQGGVYRGEHFRGGAGYSLDFTLTAIPDGGATIALLAFGWIGLHGSRRLMRCGS